MCCALKVAQTGGGWKEGGLRYSVVRKEGEVKVSAGRRSKSPGPELALRVALGVCSSFFCVWWKLAVGSERYEDIDGPESQRE